MIGREPGPPLAPVLAEGLGWVRRIETGDMSPDDHRAFASWRAAGPEAEAALHQAQLVSDAAREAARELLAERAAARVVTFRARPTVSRRMLIGSAIAASVAGAVVIARAPGLLGQDADLATGKGERRTVALAEGLDLVLDAQTRANVAATARGHRVDLLGGRAEVEAALGVGEIELVAGSGRIVARNARFEVRLDGEQGCVTCLAGTLVVAHHDRRIPLTARQQLRYDAAAVQAPVTVDPAVVSSWRNGSLIFHRTPLVEVVREINRYRSGRITLARASVGAHEVSGVFYIDRMDRAVSQIEQITGARAVELPGGLVVLT